MIRNNLLDCFTITSYIVVWDYSTIKPTRTRLQLPPGKNKTEIYKELFGAIELSYHQETRRSAQLTNPCMEISMGIEPLYTTTFRRKSGYVAFDFETRNVGDII